MSLLIRGGLVALGLAALQAAAQAQQQTYVQTKTTKAEVTQPNESRFKMPFFRFFSSNPKPAQTTSTIAETAEPPLATGEVIQGPALAPAPTGPVMPVQPSPVQIMPYAPGTPTPRRVSPAPQSQTSGYQPTTANSAFQPMPATRPVSVQSVQPAQVNYPTVIDFASSFQPLPGQYQITVLHPISGQPVRVAFQLPPSRAPYKTRSTARYVEFDSPDHTVGIRFARDGRVVVDQD